MIMPQPSTATISVPATAESLCALGKGDRARISALAPAQDAEQTVLRERLQELGFVPGENLRVVAISYPARDPIAVRIGNTTFALRRHEAQMIHVERP